MAKGRPLRLRPLGIMDVLDETIELFRSNFWLLVGIAAIVQIPIALLNPAQSFSALAATGKMDSRMIGFVGAIVLWLLLYVVVGTPLVTGALTGAISERYLSRQATIVDSYKRVFRFGTFLRLIWANAIVFGLVIAYYLVCAFIVGLLIFATGAAAGFDSSGPSAIGIVLIVLFVLAAIVPLVWFGVAATLTPAAIVIESLTAWQGVKRSLALTKGMIWSIIAASIILAIAVAIMQYVIVLPLQFAMLPQMLKGGAATGMQMPFWFNLVQAIVQAVFAPLTYIVYVLFYYDARVRKEGFDLVMLAEQLDSGGHAALSFGESAHPQERDESWRTTERVKPVPTAESAVVEPAGPQETEVATTNQPGEDQSFDLVDLPSDEPGEPVEPPKDEPV